MKVFSKWQGLYAIAIILATLLAYIPAMQAGFIWDDNDYVTDNQELRSLEGLKSIWLEPRSTPQYYPMVFTTFWAEYRLWGLNPTGYHVVNVLLHALSALLLWRLLLRLDMPGAWLVAMVFAIHPVHVESVAWVTERKNVLSGFFYFSSALCLIRFFGLSGEEETQSRQWWWYGLGLLLFVFALFSKTITCSLPAATVLVLWWKRGRVSRQELLALVPFFLLGLGLGLATVWLERYHVGTELLDWHLSFVDRCLIAGRALWFYAGKLVWPVGLIFNYPRWIVDSGLWWQYIYPIAVLGVILALWAFRGRLGRGPLVGVLFFGGTLLPALGFFDIFPFRYSYVADHFQYLASVGLLVLLVSALMYALSRVMVWPRQVSVAVWILLLALLGVQTWRQGYMYENLETLWTVTLEKNPASAIAHCNLGFLRQEQGRYEEAIAHYSEALRLRPDFAEAPYNMGNVLEGQGRLDEAISYYSEAIRIKPNWSHPHNKLGIVYQRQGRYEEAVVHLETAVRFHPRFAEAWYNLGIALAHLGKLEEAADSYGKALQIKPEFTEAHNSLGNTLMRLGKVEEATSHYTKALQLKPKWAEVHNNLGNAMVVQWKIEEATAHYAKAVELKPDYADAHNNLAVALTRQGRFEEATVHYSEALRLKPGSAETHNNFGVALFHMGKVEESIVQYKKALELAPDYAEAHNNLGDALARQDNLDEAAVHYTRALQIRADYPEAHNNLGVTLARQGKLEEAIVHFTEALRIRPDYVEARRNLGIVMQEKGEE
ncbi:MAG: tetratricopeptide repeat protein [Syntrophobacterales bacterium]|jgi:tetratricopeptide (TPR) repeat protein